MMEIRRRSMRQSNTAVTLTFDKWVFPSHHTPTANIISMTETTQRYEIERDKQNIY